VATREPGEAGRSWSWSAEAAEAEINRFIEKRAQQAQDANSRARAFAESLERYNLRAQAERRREWIQFHNGLAHLHQNLAAEHEEKAAKLANGEGIAVHANVLQGGATTPRHGRSNE
jgi:hypothetical protein